MEQNANITLDPTIQKIEISITGRNLKDDGDVFSKIDPKVRLYRKNNQGIWLLIDETETIQNNLNPDFQKAILIDYNFEKKQFLKFDLIDVDDGGKFDRCGEVEVSISQLMGAKNQTSILDLKLPKHSGSRGKLIIRCEAVKMCNEWLFLETKAQALIHPSLCCGSMNPKLAFYRSEKDNTWDKVFETEVLPNNYSPLWRSFDVSVQKLVNGDHQRKIKMVILSQNGDLEEYIGDAITDINEIVQKEKREFNFLNSKTKKRAGRLNFMRMTLNVRPTFLDYIRGGIKLNTLLAIDFTGSNGDPKDITSLHAIRPNLRNQYQKAIDGVMQILIHYDYDQQVAMYGFGAILNFPNMASRSTTLHCFPCNANPQFPYANGLSEIDTIYENCIRHVTLSGPTFFAPMLKEFIKIGQTQKQKGSLEYTIMVIMTDGQINDMDASVNCIVECSMLPISIIIIGIGNDDFSNMEILDGDSQGLKSSSGVPALRDCVQFVPYVRFPDHEALSCHVLEEIPEQVATYYRLMNIPPNPPVVSDINSMGFNQVPLGNIPQQQLPSSNPLMMMNQQPQMIQNLLNPQSQIGYQQPPFYSK